MLGALTGLGLSAAAGLNAYVPFLVVALVASFTDVVTLPAAWAWIESPWAIAVGLALLAVEVVLDKVPVVDTLNDLVQTAVRPASAGVVVAATSAAQEYEQSSSFFTERPWIGVAGGVVVAFVVHATKSAVRPVANAGTAGLGAPVLSTAEDGASVGLSLAALFLPLLVLVLLVALAWVLGRLLLRGLRRQQGRRRGRQRVRGRGQP